MIQFFTSKANVLVEENHISKGTWINIAPPFNLEELEQLSIDLDIPIDFLTDPLDIDERSRYEYEDDAKVIIINTPIENKSREANAAYYITVPVGILLTPDYLITISSFESPILNKFFQGKIKNFDPTQQEQFVLQFFEQNVIRYLYCLKDLNIRRNRIEQELYDSSRNSELQQLLSIEKSLVYFVTALSSNELIKMKMLRSDFLKIKHNEDLVDSLESIITDNSQALEMANVYTNILGGTMDAFASIISNNLNNVIKRLTMITIILMVPTLVTSIFGMNVINGLETNKMAMLYIMITSLVLTLTIAWVATKRKWF